MSDGAVASIVTGCVTIAMSLIGFLTLWVKLKYGEKAVKVVEDKVDTNTDLTTEAKDAANKAVEHAASCDKERAKILAAQQLLHKGMEDHDTRIASLEREMSALKVSVEGVTKNIDSTRHEMRGHLQTLSGKLDLITLAMPRQIPQQQETK